MFSASNEALLEEIFQDEKVLETTLSVLQQNRDVQLCNNILQVLLELDFGSTMYFVSKACEREAESAVKKMGALLAANPRMGIISAISPNLFRETTSNIIILVEFFRITGTSYLQTVMQDMMVQVEAYAKLNQVMGGAGETAVGATVVGADKSDRLLALTSQLVLSILKTPPSKLPATLRYVCKYMYTCLMMQLADCGHVITPEESSALLQLVLSHLLGVRFFGLGLTCPSLFLLPEPRSEFSQDSLMTLSNILLNIMGVSSSTKLDPAWSSVPMHLHLTEYTTDMEAFFASLHKSKANASAIESHRAQLNHWLLQVADFNDLENKPTSPLAFFALETCGAGLAVFLCDNALDYILACDPPIDHRPLFELFSNNASLITRLDLERRGFKPQIVVGPGIWNPVQYGRAWNFEIKLPSVRIQDIFVWIPTTITLPSPASNRSTLDWILKSSDNDYLILIICQLSNKVSASVQKYIRSWRKIYPEITSTKGQLMAVTQAQLSQSSYVSKKFGANFPLVFDHHEHIASYFHVGGHGNTATGADDVTVILVDSDGRLVMTFDSTVPNPKTVINAVAAWKLDAKKPKPAQLKRRKTFKRNGSDHNNSSDSDEPHDPSPSTPR